MEEDSRETLNREAWKVERYALLDEVLMVDGSVRYHVQIQDAGRPPFLTRWFNEEDRAQSFIDKVKTNGAAE